MENTANKTTATPATTVIAIMAFLAQENSVAKAAKKFNLGTGTIASMVSGKTHSATTGLSKEGNNGILFIRANKAVYTSAKKGVIDTDAFVAVDPSAVVKKPATKAKPKTETKAPVAPTTVKDTTTTTVATIVPSADLSDNENAILAEAVTGISTIDAEIVEMKNRMETLYAKRDRFDGIVEMFSAK